MNALEKDVINTILENIDELSLIEDFPSFIYRIFSKQKEEKAIEWIIKHFIELRPYVEDYRICYDCTFEPFRNPKEFQTIITIFITKEILSTIWKDCATKEELKRALEKWR